LPVVEVIMTLCSCGCTEPHVIARRKSADDYTLKVWADGDVTFFFGHYIRGFGRQSPEKAQAVRVLMDDFGVLTTDEIPGAVKHAMKLLKKGTPEGEVRSQVLRAL
jgi:hypothetical protein